MPPPLSCNSSCSLGMSLINARTSRDRASQPAYSARERERDCFCYMNTDEVVPILLSSNVRLVDNRVRTALVPILAYGTHNVTIHFFIFFFLQHPQRYILHHDWPNMFLYILEGFAFIGSVSRLQWFIMDNVVCRYGRLWLLSFMHATYTDMYRDGKLIVRYTYRFQDDTKHNSTRHLNIMMFTIHVMQLAG